MTSEVQPPAYSKMTSDSLFEILGDPDRQKEEIEAARYELSARGALEPEPHQDTEPSAPVRSEAANVDDSIRASAASATNYSAGVGWIIIVGGIAIWLAYILAYAPRHALASPKIPKDCGLWTELAQAFPDANPRIEQLQAQNLDVYIHRQDFESVAYPDRKTTVKNIGKSWGDHTHWYYASSVRIRDIRTGKVLASYSCNTGRVDLKTDGWF